MSAIEKTPVVSPKTSASVSWWGSLGPTKRMGFIAFLILLLDQATKLAVLRWLGPSDERVVVDGFFKLVHWTNTGAAWSLFNQASGSNAWLSLFAVVALVVLFFSRRHFDIHTVSGQLSLGLIFGGIVGNLTDRFFQGHVIDFLYFYLLRRGGGELGFPAFNIADVAICTGVGLVFLMSWQKEGPGEVKAQQSGSGA